MVAYYGDFAEDTTVRMPFNTFDSNDPSASVTITDLADADIKVHKDGSATPITTDGATIVIDINSITGSHVATIDTSADAAYSTGSDYMVRIEGTTIDAGTVNAWVGSFSIENRHNAAQNALIITDTEALLVDTEAVITDTEAILVDTEAAITERSTLLTDTEAILVDSEAIIVDTEAAITERSTILTDTEAILVDTGTTLLADTEATRTDAAAILVDTEAAIGERSTLLTDTEAILVDTETIGTVITDTEALLVDTEAIIVDTESLNDTKIPDTISLANINAEMVDVLFTDTDAEPAQGAPGATISLADKIGFLYKAWRNRSNQTATTYQLFNDDASTVDHKATVSDDATTAEKGEVAAGP